MTASSGKTLGLIVVILLILLVGFRLTPLFFAPLGVFSGVVHAVRAPILHRLNLTPFGVFDVTVYSLAAFALLIIWLAVIIWVYRDAERRGMSGVLWALLVFIGNLVGLLIYLIVRSDNRRVSGETCCPSVCGKCGKTVGKDHAYCPYCGERLQPVCPKCGKPADKSWQVCPHCGERLS